MQFLLSLELKGTNLRNLFSFYGAGVLFPTMQNADYDSITVNKLLRGRDVLQYTV
jgi:hypothetical protein